MRFPGRLIRAVICGAVSFAAVPSAAQQSPVECAPGPAAMPAEVYVAARLCSADPNAGFRERWTTVRRAITQGLATVTLATDGLPEAGALEAHWIPRDRAAAALSALQAWQAAANGSGSPEVSQAYADWQRLEADREAAAALVPDAAPVDLAATRVQLQARAEQWRREAEAAAAAGQTAEQARLSGWAEALEDYLQADSAATAGRPDSHPRAVVASLSAHLRGAEIFRDRAGDGSRTLTVRAPPPAIFANRAALSWPPGERYDLLVSSVDPTDPDAVPFRTVASTSVVKAWPANAAALVYALVILALAFRWFPDARARPLAGANGRMSLALTQIALFSVVVIGLLIVHLFETGLLGDLSNTVLLLMGLLAVGSGAAKVADHTVARIGLDNWLWLRRRGWIDEDRERRTYGVRQLFTNPQGRADIFRVQAALVSLLVAIYLISLGPTGLAQFDLNQNILGLLGISQATYVVGKAVGPPKWKELDDAITTYRENAKTKSETEKEMQDSIKRLALGFESCFGYPPESLPRPGDIGVEVSFDPTLAQHFPMAVSYRGVELVRLARFVPSYSHLALPREAAPGDVIVREVRPPDGAPKFALDRPDSEEIAERGVRRLRVGAADLTDRLPDLPGQGAGVGIGLDFDPAVADRFPLEIYLDGVQIARLPTGLDRYDHWRLPYVKATRRLAVRDRSGTLFEAATWTGASRTPGIAPRTVATARIGAEVFASAQRLVPGPGTVGLDIALDADAGISLPMKVTFGEAEIIEIKAPTEGFYVLGIPAGEGSRTLRVARNDGRAFTEEIATPEGALVKRRLTDRDFI